MLLVDNTKVPVPVVLILSVPLDTPPVIATVDIVNVSLAVTLIVSLLLAVLSKVIPPVNVLPALPLSFNVLPLFKVIALAIVNADAPDNLNIALLITLLVPSALLFCTFKVPALMNVVPL